MKHKNEALFPQNQIAIYIQKSLLGKTIPQSSILMIPVYETIDC